MKKFVFCIISMMLFLFYACTIDELTDTDQMAEEQGLLTGDENLRKQGPVITVEPTGADDTENLIQAFEDAKAAGPGATVKLVAGDYNIGMIEVRDFNGYLEGAGKEETVIWNLPDLPCEEVWLANKQPALIKFIGGDIYVTDMTIQMRDGEPCVRGEINDMVYGDMNTVIIFADYSTNYIPENRFIKAVVENVDFIAGNDGGYGVYGTEGNVAMTLFGGMDVAFLTGNEPLSSGEFTVRNCYFENGLCGPDFFGMDEKSSITIENTEITGGFQQIFIGALYGTKVNIKNNKFSNGWYADLYISENQWQSWGYFVNAKAVKSSEITIMNNEFDSPEGVMSIYLFDNQHDAITKTGFPSKYWVKNNIITTQDGGTGIYTYNLSRGWFGNNKFYGSGTAGIIVDGNKDLGHYGEYNAFLACKYYNTNYDLANIVLTEHSRYNVLKGACLASNVIDEGTGNLICNYKLRDHYKLPKDFNIHQPLLLMRKPALAQETP